MTALRSRRLHTRVWGTALVVVVALAGAGLAVAADLPHSPSARPTQATLPDTAVADAAARPAIDALADELRTADQHVAAVATHGREALEQLQGLDLDAMRAAIARGDQANAELHGALAALRGVLEGAIAAVDQSRLGSTTAARFAALVEAASSAEGATAYWPAIGADLERVADIVEALARHDELVFTATSHGRRAEWKKALDYLWQAAAPLAEARAKSDQLKPPANPDTLNHLLDRYAAYDRALTRLYRYIRQTGNTDSRRYAALQTKVERAQAALPTNPAVMTVIVGETAGPSVSASLAAIEAIRLDAAGAL